jgi:hypothetical protein
MGDTSLTELKNMMTDLMDKMTLMDGKLASVHTKLVAVEGEITSVKVDQGCLHVAVDNVQPQRMEFTETSASGAKNNGPMTAAPPAASHKLRFPKFNGTSDPIARLHRCDQFFRAARTAEDEKVWLASFYMDDAAQQWYYRLEHNQGVPTWTRFVELVNPEQSARRTHQAAAHRDHRRLSGPVPEAAGPLRRHHRAAADRDVHRRAW